jgi:copper transport protein
MKDKRRNALIVLFAVLALAVPAAASAHAYLIKTFPSAATILDKPPPDVQLTFDEAVEPKFAIISVTNEQGHQVATSSPARSPADPDTLVVTLKPDLPEGWYLVYWRAISVDGHPVQGAFTFAVGPNPGPAPQFPIPHIAGSATTPQLVAAKWFAFLTVMTSIGLLAMRLFIGRPAVRRAGASLKAVTVAFAITSTLGLIAVPVYLEEATAIDSLRSFFQVGSIVPLWRTTAFGRAYVDLWIIFALFVAAAWIAIWVDRPEREHRSIAELLAGIGAVAAAAAAVSVPGAAGHAAQTAPRGLAVTLDWLHVASASIWVGGLAGLLLVWRAQTAGNRIPVLSVVVPRFSNVALVSVLVLLGSGVWAAILHLPILSALWTTHYGEVILLKAGLLLLAMLLASVNLLRTKPRLAAASADAELAESASGWLRGLVTGELLIVVAAIAAAALLTSLAPPSKYLSEIGNAQAKVGPGKVVSVVKENGFTNTVLIDPNKAVAPNTFTLKVTKNGSPVRGANVTLTFAMLDMEMGTQEFQLNETAPGVYSHDTPALVMVGHWGLSFSVTPKNGQPYTVLVVDHAAG